MATPAMFWEAPPPPAPLPALLPLALTLALTLLAGAGQQSVPQHTSRPRLQPQVICFGRVPSWNCRVFRTCSGLGGAAVVVEVLASPAATGAAVVEDVVVVVVDGVSCCSWLSGIEHTISLGFAW